MNGALKPVVIVNVYFLVHHEALLNIELGV